MREHWFSPRNAASVIFIGQNHDLSKAKKGQIVTFAVKSGVSSWPCSGQFVSDEEETAFGINSDVILSLFRFESYSCDRSLCICFIILTNCSYMILDENLAYLFLFIIRRIYRNRNNVDCTLPDHCLLTGSESNLVIIGQNYPHMCPYMSCFSTLECKILW